MDESKMNYIEAPEEFERGEDLTVFLAGGISNCPDWQQDFVDMLKDTDLILFNPRRANFPMGDKSEGRRQILWEAKYLDKADLIIFWFPMETICPIVLFELGSWSMTDKPILVGVHPKYSRRFDVETQLMFRRPDVLVVHSVDALAQQLIEYHTSCQSLKGSK